MLTEDKLQKALEVERRLYANPGFARPLTKEPGPRVTSWLILALIIVVALIFFLSDRLPLLFLLLIGSLVANYLMRRHVRRNGSANERYANHMY